MSKHLITELELNEYYDKNKTDFNPEDVMEWELLDVPIYAEGLNDWVIADRHLPSGVRQHVIKGEVPKGTVWQNAEIFGSGILK